MKLDGPTTITVRSILEILKRPFIADDDVKAALEATDDAYNELRACDNQGHTPLHVLSANAREACIEILLTIAGEDAGNLIALQDNDGNTPLHLCANYPMICYQLAAEAPGVCLIKNKAGLSPVDLARQHGTGEAMNALLLGCSGNSSPEVINSMDELTKKGAVADTWAPNGQSSLMLAAAANSAEAITLLLSAGASLELQDAMGRTALMWAAGSGAVDALKVLLDAGASLAVRDRRYRSACDYAEKPEAKKVLEARVKELENKATAAQEALLAELLEEEERKAASKASKKAKKKEKNKVKKKGGKGTSVGGGPTTSTESEKTECEVEETEINPQEEEEEGEEKEAETTSATTATEASAAVLPLPSTSTTTITTEEQPTTSSTVPTTTTTITKTPVMVSAPLNIAAAVRPPSPEWCTVGAPKKEKQHQQPAGANTSSTPPKSAFHSHHSHHSHQYQHHRSPSVGSVTSVSSGTSHETDGSGKHSGSERSVLRRVAAAGAVGTSVPRPPAPIQRQAVCTRSTSGGEEVGAAALFGVSNTTMNTTDGVNSGSGGSISFKPGSWASVAAAQLKSVTSGTSLTGTGSLTVPAPVPQGTAEKELPQLSQQQQVTVTHTTLATAMPPPGGPWRLSTGINTLTSTTLTTPSGGSSIDGSHSNYSTTNNNAITTAPITISPASAVALQRAAAEEIAALRSEIQRLKLKNAAAELAHHQELVAILQDASQHENAAVAKATSDERLACSIRFAALLQNNGVALAGAIPGLLAGAGITTANDLDMFMNASNNSGSGITTTNGTGRNAGTSGRAIAIGNLNNTNTAVDVGGAGTVAETDTSPLSTSPFSYEVGEHLRGDFFGNHSAFMVPAIETDAVSASPPSNGHASAAAAAADAFLSKAAGSASAWSPLGNGTSSSVWGSAIR